jgi:uncharacterized protein (TIGR00369 family)
MTQTVEQLQRCLEATKKEAHPNCVGCGSAGSFGLDLKFLVREDGGVEADFPCQPMYQGYPGLLHGGVTSMLLDAAMTNCLFAHAKMGVTARLIIRFSRPVVIGRSAVVRAWLRENEQPLYVLEAELAQDGRVLVRAAAKFMRRE